MAPKIRPTRSALQATTVLNEQRHNQDGSKNPNHLHVGNIRRFSVRRPPYFRIMLSLSSPLVLRGHTGAVYDATWVHALQAWCSAGGDGVVARWKWGEADGHAVFHHSSPFYAVCAWGDSVVAGNATGELFAHWGTQHVVAHEHKASVFALHADASGVLWSGDGEGHIRAWERRDHALQSTLHIPTALGKIRHIGPHPSGLIVAGGSGAWAILDTTQKRVHPVTTHDRSCYWAMHLPEKDVVISGGQDGKLVACQGESPVLDLALHQSAIYRGVRVGEMLWTAGRDKDVKAWDIHSLEAAGKLPRPHTRSVNALAQGGPEGRHLVTGGDDRTLKVWTL